ncbi:MULTISPECIES: ATP-binding protein [unclassified Streptomyces]|nr:ATP-binding protein [Streptomyces sp. TSRI0281]
MSQSTTARDKSEQGKHDGPQLAGLELSEPQILQAMFLPDPLWVPEMRRAARVFLHRLGVRRSTVDGVELAVSELVTNAIQHGGSEAEVGLRISAIRGTVRVSVVDQNSAPAVLRRADAESGRGLLLVAAVADNWGSSGEEAWCEFRHPLGKSEVAAT